MPIKMVGYKYLRDAIEKAVGEPDGDLSITKTIYPAVAEEYGTSATNVERNIRYIIAATWERNDNIEVPFCRIRRTSLLTVSLFSDVRNTSGLNHLNSRIL